MDSGLNDAVALVTGASGGIGGAIARALAAEGCRVALHSHSHPEATAQLAAELSTPTLAVSADLRDEQQTAALFARIVAEWGRIDSVVVNAGIWAAEESSLARMTLEQWRNTLEADLTSAFLTCRGFLRHLEAVPRAAASIVLVGSTAALFGEAGHADYSAAKAGMVYGLTRSLKNEIVRLAPRGRVNCVCPGWTVTPMTESLIEDRELVGRVTATMPLRKVALAEDVAAAVVFLASERLAGHVSGAILPVAGGMEGRLLHSRSRSRLGKQ